MKLLKGPRGLPEYALLFAALLPTLLILLAAGVCLADREAVMALTMSAAPVYAAD